MYTNKVSEYLKKNSDRKNIPAKIKNGKMIFFHNGKWINKEKFNELYPVYDFVRNVNTIDNPDKTKIV